MIIAGLDDAGRGPVIGPLVIAGVAIQEKHISKLSLIGVKDSKILSSKTREKLSELIKKIVDNYRVIEFSPNEIDEVVFKAKKLEKLNFLEAKGMAQIIINLKPDLVYVDASDVNPTRFAKQILLHLPFQVKIISEHNADKKYHVVSAASILAKVHRDNVIKELKEKYGDFGSLPFSEKILIVNEKKEIDLINIGELVENKLKNLSNEKTYVFSVEPETLKIKLFQITDFTKHPPQRILKITLSNNQEVKLSINHTLFKFNNRFKLEKVKALNLKPGDYIAAASCINLEAIEEKIVFNKSVIENKNWLKLFYNEKKPKQKRFLIEYEGFINDLFNSDIQLIKVTRIEDTKLFEPVYDIEVKPKGRTVENFLGGSSGVILHNSGYPSDPKTINFLKEWYKEYKCFPPIARKSWKTLKKIKDEASQLKFK
ncbi:ribonuclease HII [Candidatus Bathyarchaeota archaeon]|nr:ribonuclease HII [Candidatus Bathyarchaeota archaeon]